MTSYLKSYVRFKPTRFEDDFWAVSYFSLLYHHLNIPFCLYFIYLSLHRSLCQSPTPTSFSLLLSSRPTPQASCCARLVALCGRALSKWYCLTCQSCFSLPKNDMDMDMDMDMDRSLEIERDTVTCVLYVQLYI